MRSHREIQVARKYEARQQSSMRTACGLMWSGKRQGLQETQHTRWARSFMLLRPRTIVCHISSPTALVRPWAHLQVLIVDVAFSIQGFTQLRPHEPPLELLPEDGSRPACISRSRCL